MAKPLEVVARNEGSQALLTLRGRNAWALLELQRAGMKGCTPIDSPGPRWSSYVHQLRRQYGLDIETVHECHSGPFPGTHARYVLKSRLTIIECLDSFPQAS